MFPDSIVDRVRWALEESVVVLGLLLFWLAVALVANVVTGVMALPYWALEVSLLRPLEAFAMRMDLLWAAVVPLTVVSASLYVLVRAGSLLLEGHRDPDATVADSAGLVGDDAAAESDVGSPADGDATGAD